MILSSVAAVIVSSAIAPTDPGPPQRELKSDHVLSLLVDSAISAAEDADFDGLVESVQSTFVNERIFGFVLQDEAGTTLASGGQMTAEQLRNAQQFAISHGGSDYSLHVIARARMGGPDQGSRELGRSIAFLMFRSGYSWLIVVIAASLSIAMSIGIARYLVRPLSSFESAGRRLAEGDFSARIDSNVEHRGDEIAEFAATFDQMAGKIENLVRSHKELLRDVSHELRSPLARAYAALSLAKQRTGGAVDDELDRVELEFERLNSLIQKLLTFSRLDATGTSLNAESLDLNWLLREVADSCNIEANAAGKNIQLHERTHVNINGVAELLSSCFENLVRNGVRHTAENTSVDITLFEPEVPAGYCQIDIRDFGPGVPGPDLEQIFEPFYKIGNSQSESTDGSGIGLAIVKKAVAVHGGSVMASNAIDGGLVISVRLPKDV